MVGAVEDRDLDVDDRVAGERSGFEGAYDALLDRRDVFARNRAAVDVVDESEAASRFLRLYAQIDVAVLAAAAGLLGLCLYINNNH